MSDLTHSSLRSEPQVHSVHETFICDFGERGGDVASDLFEIFRGLDGSRGSALERCPLLGFVNVHQVDVGAEVQLFAAWLAQRDYTESGADHVSCFVTMKRSSDIAARGCAGDVACSADQHFG